MKYSFKPSIFMTLATVLVMALCIKLGFWQYNKAEAKEALQQQLDKGLIAAPVALPETITDVEAWRYKRVKFAGVYDARYQVLLDNQVENTVVGYHVYTPVQLAESKQYVLVNRGWVKGALNRKLPENIVTPQGVQQFEGDIYFPLAKVFTLEAPQSADSTWQGVWQHMNMQRYAKAVPFAVLPYVVRLETQSTAGGFVRNWPLPGARVITHLGYAYQWFGFALTLLVIYIVLNIKKVKSE